MKLYYVLPIVLGSILSAQSQTSQITSGGSNIDVRLEVHPDPVGNTTDHEPIKYHTRFELIAQNKGAEEYQVSGSMHQLWKLVVLQQPSGEKLKFSWTGKDSVIKSISPQTQALASAEWDAGNDAVAGNYIAIATFLPTNDVRIKEFTVPPPPPPLTANILFTGRLMGYYRLPDRQSFTAAGGCTSPETDASPDAITFFKNFRYNSNEHQVRVGMGDNFAPNYYSRAFKDPPPRPEQPGKEMYYWDTSNVDTQGKPDPKWKSNPKNLTNIDDIRQGHGTIPTDNVACFLFHAHYDAIVPGKHDFHYGPERLRELARLLATVPTDNTNFQPVEMLAANMMIKTSWAKDHEPVPDSAKHQLPFVTKYLQRSTAATGKGSCSPSAGFNLEVANITDGGFAFPWMQFVRIDTKGCRDTFTAGTAPPVYLCSARGKEGSPGDPDNFLNNSPEDKFCNDVVQLEFSNVVQKKESPDTQKLFYRLVPSKFKRDQGNPSALIPGHNYAICTPGPNGSAPYCVRFSVYTPFFQYPDWPKQGRKDDKQPRYNNPDLYALKNDSDADRAAGLTPIVIFGIVDPQMVEHIGADNYSWQTVSVENINSPSDSWRKEYKTQLAIADPLPTLTELEYYFERDYCLHHNHNFRGIRILLAQMSPAQAKNLAEHLPKPLRFDVIVSTADNALATPNQIVRIEPAAPQKSSAPDDVENTGCRLEPTVMSPSDNGALATPTTFIAVPPSHDSAKQRWLQARELHVMSDGQTFWNYELSGQPRLVPPVEEWTHVSKQFWDRVYDKLCDSYEIGVCHKKGDRPEDGKRRDEDDMAAIQQLSLLSIREKTQADVALLQERDFYSGGLQDYLSEHCAMPGNTSLSHPLECGPQSGPSLDIQQILERIIWKGDFIKTQSITGSVLKTILKESEQFAKAEKKGYIPVLDLGRPLVTLGIRPDPNKSGDYLIHAKPLDASALYTVATSDFIALGDTGYPELATPPVGDPDLPAVPRGKLYRISGSACAELAASKDCDIEIKASDYYDRVANRTPDDPRGGNTNLRKFYAWTFLRRRFGQRSGLSGNVPVSTRVEALKNTVQTRVEADPSWLWSFDKLSIGFSGLSHTGGEQTVSQRFGGALNPLVTAPHSHSWDWDANSKFTFYHTKSDWFLSDILQYSSNFTSQVSGPRSQSQPRNQLAFDGGTYFHLYPWTGKTLPQLSLVFSGHLETVVGNPITRLQLATSTLPLIFKQGRTVLLLGRSGFRWENRKSYIEAGLEGGQTLNAIQQFDVLVASSGPTVHCRLEASVSLTNCINKFNQNNPATPVTNLSTVTVVRNPQDRYGAYWTMRVTVPINSTLSYNFQDLSDYFFLSSGDNSADTRFRHQLIHTLKFMVFPNLSFEPTYTIYLYENKLDYHFLLQQQYAVKINYSFNFSNQHEAKRQFKYKKPSGQ